MSTRALSQLSTTANRPAKQMPCKSRMMNHGVGWMNSTMQIEAAEAMAARAENVLM
ncbi:hypothetical protein D3C72_2562720 [compost metagenome]